MPMKIVLTQDVENLGRVGEVVNVKPGYGRNFLIPQGMALLASRENMAYMDSRRKVYEAAAAKVRGEAEAIAARIASLSGSVARKVGESETLYGSVTTADIAAALEKGGVIVDKRRILLAEPIKKLGEYTIPVRLHADVTAQYKLAVVAAQE